MRAKTRAVPVTLAILPILATLGAGAPALAGIAAATEALGSTSVEWQTQVPWSSAALTVSGPDGLSLTKGFLPGQLVGFSLGEIAEFPDGTYTYELVLSPLLDTATRAALAEARTRNDDTTAARLRKAGKIPGPQVVTGVLVVLDGAIVPRGLAEPASRRSAKSSSPRSGGSALGPLPSLDQVIADDLIVQGSACVGLDCVNNEIFGFDTIRMKGNNDQLGFDDTSTAAGFPANDWQLTANDSASGGANKFSIDDVTDSRTPFTITASAPTSSIFVDSAGRLGLRTSTPVLDVHVSTSNTPAFRLERSSSSRRSPPRWPREPWRS